MSKERLPKERAPERALPADDDEPDSVILTEAAQRIELQVQRALRSDPRLRFASLHVHRVDDGVCLEGVVEVDGPCPDFVELARRVEGVNRVLNHLVVRGCRKLPAKG